MRNHKVRTWPLRLSVTLCALTFLLTAFMAGTYGWQSEQKAQNDFYGAKDALRPIELVKLEKLSDGTETEKPIPNTVFCLYRENGTQIGGRYTTDKNGKINMLLVAGNYYFKEITPSIGYTYDTDNNGDTVTCYNFTVTEQEKPVLVKAYNKRIDGDLLIRKSVENADGSPLSEAQRETAFEFTVTFSDGGTYTYRVDHGEEQSLTSGGRLTLRSGQTATFENLPMGLLYDVKETPAEGYIVSANGHRGNITADIPAVADFVNRFEKEATGSLLISKEVKGKNADLDRSFTFSVIIGDITETFSLKHGETKEITGIPIGSNYLVTEQDDTPDYIASANRYEGCIVGTETVKIHFVNIHTYSSEEEFGSLTISKRVIGDHDDPDKEFSFGIVFEGEGAPENKTFLLKADESKTFDKIPHGVTYTVTETDGAGYDIVLKHASGTIVGEHTANIVFTNKVPEQSEKTVKLTVQKLLKGELIDSDKERRFRMTLTMNGQTTEFTLKGGEIKKFDLPLGAVYEIREENYIQDGFSQSIVNGAGTAREEWTEVTVTNTYIGNPRVEIRGEKTWDLNGCKEVVLPEFITVRLKNGERLVEERTVRPNINNQWIYGFIVPKYNDDGTEAVYTLEEDVIPGFRASYDGYDIKNTYVRPIDVDPPIITKLVTGENVPTSIFEFIFTGQHGTPMPEGSVGYRKELELTGAGELEIGVIRYDKAGTYIYIVHEKNSGASGWTYDTAVYTVTVVVTETNYVLSAKTTIEKLGSATDKIVFTNTFQQSNSDTVIISGIKTWNHGTNAEHQRPNSIIVELYADGKLAMQKLVTAEDNWQYCFEMQKNNADGTAITYTIDEAEVKDYRKQIDGYDLINIYIEPSDAPETPGFPPTKDNTNTGFWFALMILSVIGLITTLIWERRERYTLKHLKN